MAIEPLTRRSASRGGEVFQRLPEVEAQIEECLSLPWPDLVKRLAIRDRKARGFIREEVVVYLCRAEHRARNSKRVSALWEVLNARIHGFVTKGLRHLNSPQARIDGRDAVRELLVVAVFDLTSDKGDYLQTRFFDGLDGLVSHELGKQIGAEQRDAGAVSLGSVRVGIKGRKLEAEVAAHQQGPAQPDQSLHIHEHLDMIEDPRHREAFVRRHRDGREVKEIAADMGVIEKTVYNWIKAAEATLAAATRDPDDEDE